MKIEIICNLLSKLASSLFSKIKSYALFHFPFYCGLKFSGALFLSINLFFFSQSFKHLPYGLNTVSLRCPLHVHFFLKFLHYSFFFLYEKIRLSLFSIFFFVSVTSFPFFTHHRETVILLCLSHTNNYKTSQKNYSTVCVTY